MVTAEDACVQLVILDECNVNSMFSDKKLPETKQLLGGEGFIIENKCQHPVKCFRGCYTIITSNCLPSVF